MVDELPPEDTYRPWGIQVWKAMWVIKEILEPV